MIASDVKIMDVDGNEIDVVDLFGKKKQGRGGVRVPGPGKKLGRPPKHPLFRKQQIGLKLTGWVREALKDLPMSRSEAIERAVVAYYKLDPPEV